MPCRDRFACAARASLLVLLTAALPGPAQQGGVVDGVGPINQSMGGASTAAPIDAAGALYWNPAGIAGWQHMEMEFGLGLVLPQSKLASGVNTGALLPFLPAVSRSGSDRSDAGFFPLPTLGLVYQPDDSPFTYGLGVFAVGGFAVNYPADRGNPILSPPPPAGVGLGALFTSYQVLQLAPTMSYQILGPGACDSGWCRSLSVGFAPTVDLAVLSVDPALFGPADDTSRFGLPFYAPGTHTHSAWGLGFQAGVYATTDAGWNFGASVKSPQWFQPFSYYSVSYGRPQTIKFHLDYPLIVSVGTSYTALPRTVIALDLRYLDFRNTNGFNRSGFAEQGAILGLGWNSVFVVALGVQYQLTDALSVRVGYTYNTNPIPDQQALFNIASPLIPQHAAAAGASYRVSNNLLLSLAYVHAFENSIRGPYVTPIGTLPGTFVESSAWADYFVLGATVQF
jgi:long-chain fatty acid transport protein